MRKILTRKQIDQTLARIDKEIATLEKMKKTWLQWRVDVEATDGSWLGLKFHQALKRIVCESPKPLTTREVADLVQAKGIPTESEDVPNLVYVTMYRRIKVDGYEYKDKKWSVKKRST